MAKKEITKRAIKSINILREKWGVEAFDDFIKEYFKVVEENQVVELSRSKWRDRCEKAEKELKSLTMEDASSRSRE